MPITNSKLEGVVNELLDLFNTQNQILHQLLDQNKQQNMTLELSPEKIKQVEDEFNFLANYARENITVDSENRYIGKMLLEARRQAEEIIALAEAEAIKITTVESQLPETEPLRLEDMSAELAQDEVVFAPVAEFDSTQVTKVSHASKLQFAKTQEVHQKYRESLDGILREIDNFLERD